MKTIVPLSLFLVSSFAFSQPRETFDLLAYAEPEGWTKESGKGVVAYTHKTLATYCRIILYESTAGTGNSRQDFYNEWQKLVVKAYKPEQAPQQVQEQQASEWNINAGTSTFLFEDAPGIVMLTTMSDAKTVISLLFIFNDESYLSDIEKFMQSVEIVRPPQATTQNVTDTAEVIGPENKPHLTGRWGKGSSIAAAGTNLGAAGYSKCVYNFKSDGTYVYKQRTFSYGVQAIVIVREHGVYSVSGNSLTVKPSSSVIDSYEKKDGADELGKLLSSTKQNPAPVTYRYAFHYFEGLNEWNLVLQAEKETQRDGPFSSNDTFENAWYFDQKFVDEEMDAVKLR